MLRVLKTPADAFGVKLGGDQVIHDSDGRLLPVDVRNQFNGAQQGALAGQLAGDVPRMGIPARSRAWDRFSGVSPPSCTTTPS